MGFDITTATPAEAAAEAERRRVLRDRGEFDQPVVGDAQVKVVAHLAATVAQVAEAAGNGFQLPELSPERKRALGIRTLRQARPSTEEHDAQVEVFVWIDGKACRAHAQAGYNPYDLAPACALCLPAFGRAEWPELALAFAVPNRSRRSKRDGAILKAEGMRKGQLDIAVPIPRGGYGGLYVEMKTADGRLTPTQRARAELLACVGNKIAVHRSAADAIEEVKQYMRLARSYNARPRETIAKAALALAQAIQATA